MYTELRTCECKKWKFFIWTQKVKCPKCGREYEFYFDNGWQRKTLKGGQKNAN